MSDAFLTTVDEIDRRIIELLVNDARIPARQIAIRLRNEGYSIQDRAVSYRIERLEKKRIIEGYETILHQSVMEDFEALYLKFKATKSVEALTDEVCKFVKELPNCLLTATVTGNWNLLILAGKDKHGKKCERQIIEKFCDQVEDYRVCNLKFQSINALNMQSVMI